MFCVVDYVGYQPTFLDKDIILREVKDMQEIANGIKPFGVDVAMSTNGVFIL